MYTCTYIKKILEKILHKQMTFHVDSFLSPSLCGYRKGFSAQQALLYLIEKWENVLDRKGYGGVLLMDLSKGFDTLNDDLLIAELHCYAFIRKSFKLIKSYFTNCWQRAKVNTSFSSWSELLLGVL